MHLILLLLLRCITEDLLKIIYYFIVPNIYYTTRVRVGVGYDNLYSRFEKENDFIFQ
jgi:hypothetical protein